MSCGLINHGGLPADKRFVRPFSLLSRCPAKRELGDHVWFYGPPGSTLAAHASIDVAMRRSGGYVAMQCQGCGDAYVSINGSPWERARHLSRNGNSGPRGWRKSWPARRDEVLRQLAAAGWSQVSGDGQQALETGQPGV